MILQFKGLYFEVFSCKKGFKYVFINKRFKNAILEYFRPEIKNRKSTSGEFWR